MKSLNASSSDITDRANFIRSLLSNGNLNKCFNSHASMTKIAAVPKDVGNHLKIFFRTKEVLKRCLSIEHWGLEITSFINPRLTVDLFTA